jgi:hypothetical protein
VVLLTVAAAVALAFSSAKTALRKLDLVTFFSDTFHEYLLAFFELSDILDSTIRYLGDVKQSSVRKDLDKRFEINDPRTVPVVSPISASAVSDLIRAIAACAASPSASRS